MRRRLRLPKKPIRRSPNKNNATFARVAQWGYFNSSPTRHFVVFYFTRQREAVAGEGEVDMWTTSHFGWSRCGRFRIQLPKVWARSSPGLTR
jgi:hypothetical protein